MIPLPRTTRERTALRDRLAFAAMERAQQRGDSPAVAQRRADAAFRSLPCTARRCGGCKHGPTDCLCDCHDPAVPARLPAPAPTTFSHRSTR